MHIPNAEDYFVQRKATWDIKFHAGLLHKIQLLQPTLLTVCYIRYSNPIPSYNIDFDKGHLPVQAVQAVHWALGFNHLGYNSKSAKSLFMSSSSSEDSFAMYSEHLEKSQHILIVGVGGIKMSDQLIILPSLLSCSPSSFSSQSLSSSWKCILVTARGPWSHLVPACRSLPYRKAIASSPHTILHFLFLTLQYPIEVMPVKSLPLRRLYFEVVDKVHERWYLSPNQ